MPAADEITVALPVPTVEALLAMHGPLQAAYDAHKDPPAAVSALFGIANGSPITGSRNATDRSRELDGILNLGMKAVRFDCPWSAVEAQRGQLDWSRVDAAVKDSRDRGLEVLLTVTYAPAWANGGRSDNKYPPLSPQEFAGFAGKAAQRYKLQGVRWFEVWNEPNHAGFWKPAPNPGAYTELLKWSYEAVKTADPDATVLGGALAGMSGGSHVSPAKFLTGMYQAGAKGTFDALSVHPYIANNQSIYWEVWGWDGAAGLGSWFGPNSSVRAILHANEPGKPIWFTETGDTQLSTTSPATVGKIVGKLREYQAQGWGGPAFWYAYRDIDSYSLVDSSWNPRPAWFELQKAIGDAGN